MSIIGRRGTNQEADRAVEGAVLCSHLRLVLELLHLSQLCSLAKRSGVLGVDLENLGVRSRGITLPPQCGKALCHPFQILSWERNTMGREDTSGLNGKRGHRPQSILKLRNTRRLKNYVVIPVSNTLRAEDEAWDTLSLVSLLMCSCAWFRAFCGVRLCQATAKATVLKINLGILPRSSLSLRKCLSP